MFRCWTRVLCYLSFPVTVVAPAASAQVVNDNMENRRVVRAKETVASSTTGCTVQCSCMDERLTGKCIEYHNDQWFEFMLTISGRCFVNIGG